MYSYIYTDKNTSPQTLLSDFLETLGSLAASVCVYIYIHTYIHTSPQTLLSDFLETLGSLAASLNPSDDSQLRETQRNPNEAPTTPNARSMTGSNAIHKYACVCIYTYIHTYICYGRETSRRARLNLRRFNEQMHTQQAGNKPKSSRQFQTRCCKFLWREKLYLRK